MDCQILMFHRNVLFIYSLISAVSMTPLHYTYDIALITKLSSARVNNIE